MEAESKLYADVHGDGQGQPSQEPPKYTPTAQQQQQQPQPGPLGVPSQPYPQYGPYPTTGTPLLYAPQSGAGYGGGYGAQQQQQIIVVNNQPAPIYVQPVHSYAGAIVYSCLSIWCCSNVLFGLIGFVLASEYCTLYCFV